MQNFEIIIWDFDGVIIFSNEIREAGFVEIFKDHPEDLTARLLEYHRANGGLSRYVKIRYFFEELLKTAVTEEQVMELAQRFSVVMKQKLTDKAMLNPDWVAFMANHGGRFVHHIASGSDGNELRMLCRALEIDHFFKSIHGSPEPKNQLVTNILQDNEYETGKVVLIGDAINDFEAARINDISFRGYNNPELVKFAAYIEHLEEWGKAKNT